MPVALTLTPAVAGSLSAVAADAGVQQVRAKSDLEIEADSDVSGAGDLVFKTGGVERARIGAAGVGTGLFAGSVADVARRLSAVGYTDALPAVHSSPPTTAFVTPGGSSPVTSPRTVPWGSELFSVYGGSLSAVSGQPSYGDNAVNNGWTPPLYYVEFDYYSGQAAPVVAVRFRNTTTNGAWAWAWIDGQPATADAENMTASSSNSAAFYGLTFAAAGKHRIRVYLRGMGLAGIDMDATDYIAPVKQPVPKIAWLGDSYVDSATGATSTPQGMAATLGRLLGAEICSFGQGGTGYANNGGGSNGKAIYGDTGRVNALAALSPDVVIVSGSTNDDSKTSSTVGANAAALYAALAAALPKAVVIVVGPTYTGTPPAGRLANRDAIKAAAAAAANVVGFIDPFDPMDLVDSASAWATGTVYAVNDTVVSGSLVYICRTAHTAGATFAGDSTKWQPTTWITGTGKAGSTAGDGNADFLISSDGVHPSQAGHDMHALVFAEKIADLFRSLALRNLIPA